MVENNEEWHKKCIRKLQAKNKYVINWTEFFDILSLKNNRDKLGNHGRVWKKACPI